MCSHVLLQDQSVGKLLVTHTASVKCADWRLGAVHAHVSLEIALRGERASADLTAEWSLTRMSTVVHLQRALAAQRSQADGTLVRISQLLVDATYQLLHFARF